VSEQADSASAMAHATTRPIPAPRRVRSSMLVLPSKPLSRHACAAQIAVWYRVLVEASFKNVTACRTFEKRGAAPKRQARGGCFPRYAHATCGQPQKIRAASEDAALIQAIALPKGSNRSGQRATCSTLAPSFIGAWDTSLRQAPNATAAITAARTIAPFIAVSLRLHVEGS
jgi:hypothetical protein